MPYKFLIFFFLPWLSCIVNAQLQAGFTVDKSGGCSPLTVQFTNTSTGTSASTIYDWSFGNGNTSKLENPGASYNDEKSYTVTLTARDGASISSKSMTVTVYRKPTVDFSASDVKGCIPLLVTLTANATPGDGTIAKYFWDFGDGKTAQGVSSSVTHSYTFPQTPPISLTVTNSNGCYNSFSKSNLIEAVTNVKAQYAMSASMLCKAGDAVSFTGKSTGGGTLAYTWDFGDGKTATEQSPSHIYTANGTYTVKLNVKSDYGCEANATPETIHVANFAANFDVQPTVCQNQAIPFLNQSTSGYDSLEWFIDNIKYDQQSSSDLKYIFTNSGNHSIKLVATYGNCPSTVTKQVAVSSSPLLTGFTAEMQGACGIPVTFTLKDTSADATNWVWRINSDTAAPFANTQSASYTFTAGSSARIFLTAAGAQGCTASVSKTVDYGKPSINIVLKNAAGSNSNTNTDCVGLAVSFAANPDSLVKDFTWDFGDGSTSTERQPKHIYSTVGSYSVALAYVTKSGCAERVTYDSIIIVNKPVFDFNAVGGTTVCGNTPVTFKGTTALGWNYYWYFSDYRNYRTGGLSYNRQFDYDTVYSVRMIAYNGNCRDTIIKNNYLTVLPAFPKIKQLLNTCDGTRGLVRFTDSSRKALQWQWDFGDGSIDTYTTGKDTITHTYTKTGAYKVVLTTTNGQCATKDSVNAYVLLKQHPILSADKTIICASDSVNVGLNGLEPNPYLYSKPDSAFNYSIPFIQYGDFTSQPNVIPFSPNSERTAISATMTQFISGKNGFRLITNSDYFNCADTTNFLPLKIHGPIAGFTFQKSSDCFKDLVTFTDTSKVFETTPIIKWVWNFGDSTSATLANAGNTNHRYLQPGGFYPRLTVFDADGCSNGTTDSLSKVQLQGPKADFDASAFIVLPNTKVDFFNTSVAYDNASSSVNWLFADGTQSSLQTPSLIYTQEGTFPVQLTTTNLQTNCTDTVVKNISVRKPNSAFTYTLSYINNNNCPPVIAQFTSTSVDAAKLGWDFGDGSSAGNEAQPTRTYNNPGMYRIVHYSVDANNVMDSTVDYIEVKGPYALLQADTFYACNALTVRLNAEVRHAKNFSWDFGDGTITPTTDTFAVHTYLNAGTFLPRLTLADDLGCTGNSVLPQKIVVDSLAAAIITSPSIVCTGGQILFTDTVQSFSKSQLQDSLQYLWTVKNDIGTDIFYSTHVPYKFKAAGTYPVSLAVKSSYGCEVTANTQVEIRQGLEASIIGPTKICQQADGLFTGNAAPFSDTLQWVWNFGANTSPLQNPAAQSFSDTGTKSISLVVTNGFCSDTAQAEVLVQEIPTIRFLPASPFVCIGDSVTVTASGGVSYQWLPNTFIKNANLASPTVWPNTSKFYTVKVINAVGCPASDSVEVKVIAPLQLSATSPLFACAGNPVQLIASGANSYRWSGSTGLSNPLIANPVANILANTTYTVIGSDKYNCFYDTATVFVRIGKRPTVQAGPDYIVKVGTEIRLQATGSADVKSYGWQPIDFLTCPTCATTFSKPLVPTNYVVTATNNDGCTAKDSVRVELICTKDVIYIPTGFTPNGDNLNDRFAILGSGIKSIRNLVIFDRWGKTVFARKNVNPSDKNSSWDGKYLGQPAPSGAYIYILELECEAGEYFSYKGTVTLIR